MNTLELAKIAANEIESLKSNKVVMAMVKQEALEKVASDLSDKGHSCTYKAVELLSFRHSDIADRIEEYVNSGLLGCVMAKYSKAA